MQVKSNKSQGGSFPATRMILYSYFSILFVQNVVTLNSSSVGPLWSSINNNKQPIYRFYGLAGQYTKFQRWIPSFSSYSETSPTDTTVSFEFRTRYSNSLLLYLDDGVHSFIALTLSEGSIQLRFKFGDSRNKFLKSGSNLNDDEWHEVKLRYGLYSMSVTTDGYPKTVWIDERRGTKFVPFTPTYFGGIPRNYRLQTLVLQSIRSERNFIGRMRGFTMNRNILTCLEKYKVWIEAAGQPCSAEG